MSAITRKFGAHVVNNIFRNESNIKNTELYVALYTSAPDKTGGGTEVSGGGYSRAAVPCTSAKWVETAGGGSESAETSNRGDVIFPIPTEDWGLVTHFALHSAQTGNDNMMFFGEIVVPADIKGGDGAPKFQDGSIDIKLDNI